jgi:hypothetical protein
MAVPRHAVELHHLQFQQIPKEALNVIYEYVVSGRFPDARCRHFVIHSCFLKVFAAAYAALA